MEKMKKLPLLALMLFPLIWANAQISEPGNLELKFNKSLWLLGYQTKLDVDNESLPRDTVYERLVEWFSSEAVNLRLKLDYKIPQSKQSEGCGEVEYSKENNGNKPFRIEGRYYDYYENRKIIGNRGFYLCSKMKVLVYEDSLQITISNFKLPHDDWLPLERLVLKDNLEFQRAYRKLEIEMNNKTKFLIEDMKDWVINYHSRRNINTQYESRPQAD